MCQINSLPVGGGRGGSGHVQVLSQVRLPVCVVGDGEPRQPGTVIIHDVAGAVSRSHDLQGAQQGPIYVCDAAGERAELIYGREIYTVLSSF